MALLLICLNLLLVVLTLVTGQDPIRSGEDLLNCSFIVKSCQTQCNLLPNQFVRWMVDIHQKSTRCQLLDKDVANTEISTEVLFVVYDVQCCSGSRANDAAQTHFADDGKVNTLIVLGVGTLLSILLMCGFLFVGLLMFYKRKQRYRTQENASRRKNCSIAKGKSVNSITTGAVTTEFSPGHKGKCVISKKREQRASESFSTSKAGSSFSKSDSAFSKSDSGFSKSDSTFSKRDSAFSNRDSAVSKRDSSVSRPTSIKSIDEKEPQTNAVVVQQKSRGEYVNHAPFVQNQNRVRTRGNNDDVTVSVPEEQIGNRPEVAKNYKFQGGFALPKGAVYEEESDYIRYPDFHADTYTAALPIQTTCQIPAVKSKSKDAAEDPYVQAPPPKSHRCQSKVEKPHAYQMLVPNGCCPKEEEGDEYNMLSHNSSVLSQDAKALLLLNNNLKTTSIPPDNKSKVILKSHKQRSPKNEIKRLNGLKAVDR